MSKFLITADWHIRIKPDIPIEWQQARYCSLIQEIGKAAQKEEAVVLLAGDIFDRNRPSLPELDLFLSLLRYLNEDKIETYLISGNHESLGQGASTYDYLLPFIHSLEYVHYNQSNQIFHPFDDGVDLYMVGHPALEGYVASDLRPEKTNILVSHFRPTVNQFIQEEIDVAQFIEPFDVCFAGDIHLPVELHDHKLIYVNHPVNSCFEKKPECGYVVVKATDAGMKWERKSLDLPNLIQVVTTASEYEEPSDDINYYRVEIQGSPEELRAIKTDKPNVRLAKVPLVVNEFVDSVDTSDVTNVNLEDSLMAYMKELNMRPEVISQMMEVYKEIE